MMQYTRLITSLIKESIAANLGGYDVQDVIADKASGGDLVREILVRSVCDPRFQSTVRVARAWQDDTRDLLEEFAEGLMSSRELTMEDAMEKMEQFLRHYFFTMIQRKSPPDKGADPIGRAGESDLHPSGHFLTASKSDIAGITVGDNLSSVLPSEIALLGSPVTLHGIRRGTDAAVDIYCLHHIFIYPVISDFFHAGRGNSPFSRKIAILRYEKISPDPAASRRLPPSGFREGTP